jgi:hypothetical protein
MEGKVKKVEPDIVFLLLSWQETTNQAVCPRLIYPPEPCKAGRLLFSLPGKNYVALFSETIILFRGSWKSQSHIILSCPLVSQFASPVTFLHYETQA